MKSGRKHKPYTFSWGETVSGIRPCGGNVWRLANGERFSARDERAAYQKWAATQGSKSEQEKQIDRTMYGDAQRYADYFRDLILNDSHEAARVLQIPQLAYLFNMDKPQDAITFNQLIKCYEDHHRSSEKTKREQLAPFRKFITYVGKTLADINPTNIKAFREYVNGKYSGSTQVAYYSRVRNVLVFAKTEGYDIEQLDKALSQLSILKPSKKIEKAEKEIMTKEEWHKILNAADTVKKAMLLCGLNMALHLGEVCELEWQYIDLEAKTYYCQRNKTDIPRAATLWDETVEALKALPKNDSSYVFVSKHGTSFNPQSQGNYFRDFFDRLGLTERTFEAMKDSAFTAAWTAEGVEGRLAQMLAGHTTTNGNDGKYLGLNPKIVAPACKAVYAMYF